MDWDYKLIAIISGLFTLFLVIVLFVSCHRTIDKSTNFRTEIGTVTDKGTKRNHNDDKYLVYTTDENGDVQVYEITDSIVARRFNSSDVYAGIEVGKTYEFTVAGKRNELFSWYPNIYEYREVTTIGDGLSAY